MMEKTPNRRGVPAGTRASPCRRPQLCFARNGIFASQGYGAGYDPAPAPETGPDGESLYGSFAADKVTN